VEERRGKVVGVIIRDTSVGASRLGCRFICIHRQVFGEEFEYKNVIIRIQESSRNKWLTLVDINT
jgi:hypothetical protein